jgi:hypothetical protein
VSDTIGEARNWKMGKEDTKGHYKKGNWSGKRKRGSGGEVLLFCSECLVFLRDFYALVILLCLFIFDARDVNGYCRMQAWYRG